MGTDFHDLLKEFNISDNTKLVPKYKYYILHISMSFDNSYVNDKIEFYNFDKAEMAEHYAELLKKAFNEKYKDRHPCFSYSIHRQTFNLITE